MRISVSPLHRHPAGFSPVSIETATPSREPRTLGAPAGLGLAGRCFLLGITGLLWVGWSQRDRDLYTPQDGFGYALGITGGLMMLFMLLYPLRKRVRWMRDWGHTKSWFHSHMVMGILAPTAILFHANFRLGASNSNVALFALLAVVASGLVGRYLYQQIHYRVKGNEITLKDLQRQLGKVRQQVVRDESIAWDVLVLLERFESRYLEAGQSALKRLWGLLILGFAARAVRRQALRLLRQHGMERDGGHSIDVARREMAIADRLIRDYIRSIRVVAEYGVYLRLFGLWHVAHIPVIVLLVITAIAHVVAVHYY